MQAYPVERVPPSDRWLVLHLDLARSGRRKTERGEASLRRRAECSPDFSAGSSGRVRDDPEERFQPTKKGRVRAARPILR